MVFTIFVKYGGRTITVDATHFRTLGQETKVHEFRNMIIKRIKKNHGRIEMSRILLARSDGKFLARDQLKLRDYNIQNLSTCLLYVRPYNKAEDHRLIVEKLQNGKPEELLSLITSCYWNYNRKDLLLKETNFQVHTKEKTSFWKQILAKELCSIMIPCVGLGMPINENYDQKSALGIALFHDEFNIVQQLLIRGADPNTKFRFGMDRNMELVTALQSVPLGVSLNKFNESRGRQYLKLLLEHDADLSVGKALLVSIDHGQYQIATYLVYEGSNLEARDYYQKTPLMIAVWRGDIYLTRLLHSVGGASPNTRNINMKNYTPFILAVSLGRMHIVKHFIQDPKQKRRELENILHHVCSFTETIIELIWCMTRAPSVDFSLTDDTNRTVFDIAKSKALQSLLWKGLDYSE